MQYPLFKDNSTEFFCLEIKTYEIYKWEECIMPSAKVKHFIMNELQYFQSDVDEIFRYIF